MGPRPCLLPCSVVVAMKEEQEQSPPSSEEEEEEEAEETMALDSDTQEVRRNLATYPTKASTSSKHAPPPTPGKPIECSL